MALVYGLCRQSDTVIRYIGVTSRTAEIRFAEHKNDARTRKNKPVHNWMAKYADVIAVVLHDDLTFEQALEKEQLEIASRSNLLNLTAGGEGAINYKHTVETKLLISKLNSGRTRQKIQCDVCLVFVAVGNATRWHFEQCGKPRKSPANKGVPMSEKQRAQVSKVHKGKIISEEQKQKIRLAQLGKPKPGTSKALKGRKHLIVSCPTCLKQGGQNAMKRFHFDNCKANPF